MFGPEDIDDTLPLELNLQVDRFTLYMLYITIVEQIEMLPIKTNKAAEADVVNRKDLLFGLTLSMASMRLLKGEIELQYPGVVAMQDQAQKMVSDMNSEYAKRRRGGR